MIVLRVEGPYSAITASARTTAGNASRASVTMISAESSSRPNHPAITPRISPRTSAIPTAGSAIENATRQP